MGPSICTNRDHRVRAPVTPVPARPRCVTDPLHLVGSKTDPIARHRTGFRTGSKPDGALAAFLFYPPARELFDRYAPDHSDQAALVAEIRSLLPAEPKPGAQGGSPGLADSFRLVDPLSQSEI